MKEQILKEEFFNRDLSWLEFNRRVLHQAQDSGTPLLERLRFLSIFTNNQDEFFMKRVGYLKRILNQGLSQPDNDGLSSEEILKHIRKGVLELNKQRKICWDELIPQLENHGIFLLQWSSLTKGEQEKARSYFQEKVFPLLTPLAVDRSHPFPFLSNLSLSLGVNLKHPKRKKDLFARLKVPSLLPHWVPLESILESEHRFLSLKSLIENNLSELFPEMEIQQVMTFRITRNADIKKNTEELEDRIDMVEEELKQRRLAEIVRLECEASPPQSILEMLVEETEVDAQDIYESEGFLNYGSLQEIAQLNIPGLGCKTWVPTSHSKIDEKDIFSSIRAGDILAHHPYNSFSKSVEVFIRQAVEDPDVISIKMTLYRGGDENPIIPLLIEAAEKGKHVVCVLELTARFDEARNIYWSEMLERVGVHVVYGVLDKKIHSKNILVIRKEGSRYRFYTHIGTGNYNPQTAKLYTDFSIFTCDSDMASDTLELFNFLTGLSLRKKYKRLLIAPVNMRKKFVKLIKNEIENMQKGKPARIIAKMNSLEDREICHLLYKASQAGVQVDLIIRGLCCLKPQVPGLSENIRVISVVGRFLEHSRVYYFQNGSDTYMEGKFFIGSADWMKRNLDKRVEVVAPIKSSKLSKECWFILNRLLEDQVQAWELQSDGSYVLRKSEDPEALGVHELLMKRAQKKAKKRSIS